MAVFAPFPDDIPLADQVKTLRDDELLDFWEETQALERFIAEETNGDPNASLEYERVILQELQFRCHMRGIDCPRPDPGK